ncbi:MAG: excisionase family DNA-binding protein [Blastochloris sp.]|jgi:excisionase family DNA binding protein|nr:excisionase family DNA-binding protein [bacterium]NJO84220.1 excisionase family DNA-binding protein [Blastochloris sp.]
MTENLLSPAQAAEIAGCHKDTIRRAVHFGLLKAQKVGRVFAISPEHLNEWIAAGMPNHRRKSTRKVKIEEQSLSDKEISEEP